MLYSYTLKDFVTKGFISPDIALDLGNFIHQGHSVIISGPAGSGKTMLLNSLIKVLPTDEKNIIIEKNSELDKLVNHYSLHYYREYVYSHDNISSAFYEILRTKPHNVIIDKLDNDDFSDFFLTSLHTGHNCLSTINSNDLTKFLTKLSSTYDNNSGLNIIVNIGIYADNSTRVSSLLANTVAKNDLPHDNDVDYVPLYTFVEDGITDGKISGHYEKYEDAEKIFSVRKNTQNRPYLTLTELYQLH